MSDHEISKAEAESELVRSGIWGRLSARAQGVFTTIFTHCGRVERLEFEGYDLWGRAILRVRRKMTTLAADAGCSVRTLSAAIAELHAAEILWVTRTGRASIFELAIPVRRKGHAAGRKSRAPQVPIRKAKSCRSDRQNPADPHSRSPRSDRFQQQTTPPPPKSQPSGGKDTDYRDRARSWTDVAIRIGYGEAMAERVGHAIAQEGARCRSAGEAPPDRHDVRNVLEVVAEKVKRYGTGNANGKAVRSPEGLIRSLIRAGGCEPSRAAQKRARNKQAANAYTAPPIEGIGRVLDVTA